MSEEPLQRRQRNSLYGGDGEGMPQDVRALGTGPCRRVIASKVPSENTRNRGLGDRFPAFSHIRFLKEIPLSQYFEPFFRADYIGFEACPTPAGRVRGTGPATAGVREALTAPDLA